MSDTQNNLLLVAGGSGAIGGAVCELAAERGLIPLVGYCSSSKRAEAIALKFGGAALTLDLSSIKSISAVIDTIVATGRPLAGLVLAASPDPEICPFGQVTVEQMDLQWRVNVLGAQVLLAGLVRHCFRPRKTGTIVGVLTQAMGEGDLMAMPRMSAYVIAKHGLQGVLAAAAAEYPWLLVRSVRPSFTESPMLRVFDERFLAKQRERASFQTPREVAKWIMAEGFD